MNDSLAKFMTSVWAGFRQAGLSRNVDSRTKGWILSYIEALQTQSSDPKTFRGLARILERDQPHITGAAEHLQRIVSDRDWDPNAVLTAAAMALAPQLIPKALILRNVKATRLGRHRYQADDSHPPQRSLLLALAAQIPDGDITLLILRWRLAIERELWGSRSSIHPKKIDKSDPYSYFKVPAGAERLSIPVMGATAISGARKWADLDLPVVAGATFSGVRHRWRRADIPYMVEWIPPATASLAKVLRTGAEVKSVQQINVDGTPLHQLFVVDYSDHREAIIRASAPQGHRQERALRTWCTNMFDGTPTAQSIQRALNLGYLRFTLKPTYQQLRDRYGLNDYRGISYEGWHRHAALVALAHAADIYSRVAVN